MPEERKPSLDEQIASADARAPKPTKPTNKNGTPNSKDEKSHETQLPQKEPEL